MREFVVCRGISSRDLGIWMLVATQQVCMTLDAIVI